MTSDTSWLEFQFRNVWGKSLVLWTIPTLVLSGSRVAVYLTPHTEIRVVGHGSWATLATLLLDDFLQQFSLKGSPWSLPFLNISFSRITWLFLAMSSVLGCFTLSSFFLSLAFPSKPHSHFSVAYFNLLRQERRGGRRSWQEALPPAPILTKGQVTTFLGFLPCPNLYPEDQNGEWKNAIKKPIKPFWDVEGCVQGQQST